MRAITDHFAHHPAHLVGCGIAIVLVIVAAAFGAPVLAGLGALVCAAMMIGMVWMMISMGSKAGH